MDPLAMDATFSAAAGKARRTCMSDRGSSGSTIPVIVRCVIARSSANSRVISSGAKDTRLYRPRIGPPLAFETCIVQRLRMGGGPSPAPSALMTRTSPLFPMAALTTACVLPPEAPPPPEPPPRYYSAAVQMEQTETRDTSGPEAQPRRPRSPELALRPPTTSSPSSANSTRAERLSAATSTSPP